MLLQRAVVLFSIILLAQGDSASLSSQHENLQTGEVALKSLPLKEYIASAAEDDAGLGDDYIPNGTGLDELQDFVTEHDAFNGAEEELFMAPNAEQVNDAMNKGIKAAPAKNSHFHLGNRGKLVLTLPMRWGGQGAPQFPVDVGSNLARVWVDANLATGDNYLWVGNFSAACSTTSTPIGNTTQSFTLIDFSEKPFTLSGRVYQDQFYFGDLGRPGARDGTFINLIYLNANRVVADEVNKCTLHATALGLGTVSSSSFGTESFMETLIDDRNPKGPYLSLSFSSREHRQVGGFAGRMVIGDIDYDSMVGSFTWHSVQAPASGLWIANLTSFALGSHLLTNTTNPMLLWSFSGSWFPQNVFEALARQLGVYDTRYCYDIGGSKACIAYTACCRVPRHAPITFTIDNTEYRFSRLFYPFASDPSLCYLAIGGYDQPTVNPYRYVMGTDFLKNMVVVLDYTTDARRIGLAQSNVCPPSPVTCAGTPLSTQAILDEAAVLREPPFPLPNALEGRFRRPCSGGCDAIL